VKKVVFDTNIFLRWLLNDVPSQAKEAQKYLVEARSKKAKLIFKQIVIF
jgi:predicted nucleic acid-binding protein